MGYYTPLRYPGGKGKLSRFVKSVFEANSLLDGHYIEPYAGGAGVACELLLQQYAKHIHVNDLNRSIYAFWYCVLNNTDELCKRIVDTKVDMDSWIKQKQIQLHANEHDLLDLGFSTFFLNRTNRSGILNGGVIGGKEQKGEWKIDARFNSAQLIERICNIAELRNCISIYNLDAAEFIKERLPSLPRKSLIFFDPPYYKKGKDLYDNFYRHNDHCDIASLISKQVGQKWMVSYDDVPAINDLYANYRALRYSLSYSARERYQGVEVVFFCDDLDIPPVERPMLQIG